MRWSQHAYSLSIDWLVVSLTHSHYAVVKLRRAPALSVVFSIPTLLTPVNSLSASFPILVCDIWVILPNPSLTFPNHPPPVEFLLLRSSAVFAGASRRIPVTPTCVKASFHTKCKLAPKFTKLVV
jgi:hypothetical protein